MKQGKLRGMYEFIEDKCLLLSGWIGFIAEGAFQAEYFEMVASKMVEIDRQDSDFHCCLLEIVKSASRGKW